MSSGRLKIYFDGGCRPNPGMMETAVVARGVTWFRDTIGPGDSQQAEWLALLHAIEIAKELGASDVVLVGDSTSVINQATGAWRARDADHVAAYRDAVSGIARVRLRQAPRAKNLAGIALQRRRPR